MTGLTAKQLNAFRDKLLQERQDLLDISRSASEGADIVELDQTRQGRLSRMDAMQGQAMSQAMQERRQLHIKQITDALKRLDDNEYGYCLRCDTEIALKRLEYNPAVTLCIKCAD